jgi:hypothetical protein
MSSQLHDPDIRNVWQGQETEKITMSIEEARLKTQKFIRRNRIDLTARSVFEIIAAFFCGIVFLNSRVNSTRVIAGLVMAMLVTSTIRNLYFSLRKPGGLSPEASSSTALTSCVEFYRIELERQRQIARQPLWQLVAALLIIAYLIQRPLLRPNMNLLHVMLPVVLLTAAGLIVLLAVRKFDARRIQDEIDALNMFENENQ